MLIKRLFTLFPLVFCISFLFSGCAINMNVGNPPENVTKEDTKTNFDDIFNSAEQTTLYQSRATIYISNAYHTESPAISSSDFVVSERFAASCVEIFTSDYVQDEIRKNYPDMEYSLTIEPLDETTLFAIIASSQSPEHLEEICNTAVSVFCKKVPSIIAGVSCNVVSRATSAQ